VRDSKSLILFRHAKSDWDANYQRDHDRPLANRGIRAAIRMGKVLSDSGRLPDQIICSTAIRAKQTLKLASDSGRWQCQTQFSAELYEASTVQIIGLLQQLPNSISSIMLVGHEPTWSQLTSELINGGNIRFPTAAMTRIDFFYSDWRSINLGSGQLRWLLQPKFFIN